MDREQFLSRVRNAIATGDLPAPDSAAGGLLPDLPTDGLVDRFVDRLEAVNAAAHRVADDEEAIAVVSSLLEQYEAPKYLAWDSEHLPVVGLLDRLPGSNVAAGVPVASGERLDHQTGYMDLRVGITGAAGGLADSGSIVLDSGPGRPRMASLIPLVHIALLRSTDIAPGLSHWIADHPTAAADTSNLVVITGPSRTADIEQILNLGVHGPKHLHVVVVAGS